MKMVMNESLGHSYCKYKVANSRYYVCQFADAIDSGYLPVLPTYLQKRRVGK